MDSILIDGKSKCVKSIFHLLLVLTTLSSCGRNNQPNRPLSVEDKNKMKSVVSTAATEADTATFLSGKDAISLLNFDGTGRLKINGENISLNLIDVSNGYDLSVIRFDKTIFSKKKVQGVSKVLYVDDRLLFTVYSSFSEDGSNEGQAVIIDVKKGAVKIFDNILYNTCNPAIVDGKLYLINDLNLIEADLDFDIKRTLPISYSSKDNPFGYLDTYLICGLSLNDDQNFLSIEFTPIKSDGACIFYSGIIPARDGAILLKDVEI